MDEEEELSSAVELDNEITKKIDYFRHEFRLTYSEVIGVLELIKHRILVEACTQENEE